MNKSHSPNRVTLRNRFWFVSLGLIVTASLFTLLLLTTFLTPVAAQRVVELAERNRLNDLAQSLQDQPASEWPSLLRSERAKQVELQTCDSSAIGEAVAVEIGNSGYCLVSRRPLTVWEANRILKPAPGRQILGLLASFIFFYLLATLLARYVNRPIAQLLQGVRAVARGEPGVTVPVPAEAEIAELAQSFNEMSRKLLLRESELKQALAAKEMIFATTSHELRTPLTVILGFCQMLEDGLKGDLTPAQLESVAVIHRNADGLLLQVEALLTLSQLRNRTLPFQRESLDLSLLVTEVTDELSPLSEKKGLKLQLEVPERPVMVTLDHQRGRQICRNLVSNAIKFTQRGGVTVRVCIDQDSALLIVSDTGVGIDPEFRASLFREFSRGPGSDGIEGTGLGLALSRRLAESLGGKVELTRSGPSGSEFCWRHPLEQKADH